MGCHYVLLFLIIIEQRQPSMALSSFLGLYFTGPLEVFLILIQLICYLNSYYVSLFLLGPQPFFVILIITFMHSRAFTAWQLANCTHLTSNKSTQNTQLCRKCGVYISNRDHHCVFTGRCVEKSNYPYFVSYLFYSYLLSAYTLVQIAKEYELLLEYREIELRYYLPLIAGLLSSAYFLIFTGALLSSSFRSIFLGIYTVEELKKMKEPKYTNSEIRKMWFSGQGRKIIFKDFRENYKTMVGPDVTIMRLLLVY